MYNNPLQVDAYKLDLLCEIHIHIHIYIYTCKSLPVVAELLSGQKLGKVI